MDILVMEIKLAINMWKQIPEIANQFEDLEYFVQQGGKKSIGTGVFLVLWFPDSRQFEQPALLCTNGASWLANRATPLKLG